MPSSRQPSPYLQSLPTRILARGEERGSRNTTMILPSHSVGYIAGRDTILHRHTGQRCRRRMRQRRHRACRCVGYDERRRSPARVAPEALKVQLPVMASEGVGRVQSAAADGPAAGRRRFGPGAHVHVPVACHNGAGCGHDGACSCGLGRSRVGKGRLSRCRREETSHGLLQSRPWGLMRRRVASCSYGCDSVIKCAEDVQKSPCLYVRLGTISHNVHGRLDRAGICGVCIDGAELVAQDDEARREQEVTSFVNNPQTQNSGKRLTSQKGSS